MVREDVSVEVLAPGAAVGAVGAQEGLLPGVRPLMAHQQVRPFERVAADVAGRAFALTVARGPQRAHLQEGGPVLAMVVRPPAPPDAH